jgi:hypothetical protein
MFRRFHAVLLVALGAALAVLPAQAVQRVFVASYGNDANTATNCGFANPCRGFTAAMTVVDPSGEVVALDAAGYGTVTITKSVTITANPGFYAGISASTGNAVTIATASINVTLRGLNINGIGATNGVAMTNGNRLSVENCVISGFSNNGIDVNTASASTVRIVDSLIRDNVGGVEFQGNANGDIANTKFLGNSFTGIWLLIGTASAISTVSVTDSVVTGSSFGITSRSTNATATARTTVNRTTVTKSSTAVLAQSDAGGVAVVTIGNSMVTGNSFGFVAAGGAIETMSNNLLRENVNDTSGTVTPVSSQ